MPVDDRKATLIRRGVPCVCGGEDRQSKPFALTTVSTVSLSDTYLTDLCNRLLRMTAPTQALTGLMSDLRASFPQLTVRLFRGPEDYNSMADVLHSSCGADGFEFSVAAEELAAKDRFNESSDPTRHRLVVESGGRMIGFTRIQVQRLTDGPVLYTHDAFLDGGHRIPGLRKALLAWNEAVASALAFSCRDDGDEMLESWANYGSNEWKEVLEAEGYEQVNHVLEMVRPDLEDIPDMPLPEGIVVRPAHPEHYRAIWNLSRDAMRDHRDFCEDDFNEARYQEWINGPRIQPHLWQIAWAGEDVVGTVRSYILDEENARSGRLRGHTEFIHVAREWRRKGIASALLSRSLAVLKEHGMQEATLDVDADNLSGAVRVYERLGFKETYHFVWYRRPFNVRSRVAKGRTHDPSTELGDL